MYFVSSLFILTLECVPDAINLVVHVSVTLCLLTIISNELDVILIFYSCRNGKAWFALYESEPTIDRFVKQGDDYLLEAMAGVVRRQELSDSSVLKDWGTTGA